MESGRGSAGSLQRPPSPVSPPSSSLSDHVFPIRSAISVDEVQPKPCIYPPPSRHDSTRDDRSPLKNPRFVSDTSSATISPSPLDDRAGLGQKTATAISTSDSVYIDNTGPSSNEQSSVAALLPTSTDAVAHEFDDNKDEKPDPKSVREVGYFNITVGGNQPGDLKMTGTDGLKTTRFRHIITDEGHAILTGHDKILHSCEDEPIHAPGAVQGFGLLIALGNEGGEMADSQFSVRIASENSRQIIGYSPQELFMLSNFMEILTEEEAENLLDHINYIRDEGLDPAISGSDIFMISLRPPGSKPIRLWCAVHINPSHPDLVLCEFEPENDQRHPIQPSEVSVPDEPEDTLSQSPTAEELHESTKITSKPLRALRGAQRQHGEAGAMQVFDIMSQVLEQFASAPNLEKFLKIVVGIVKELTGFHRVMIYQFDTAFNGKVVAEAVDPAQTRDLYYGLHFPASDIPKQARELYKSNKVRLLYDRELESARLVCRTVRELEKPFDLSHSYLRAMSPLHLKYLANMAVRSSMSISIMAFGELWGLITCHGYGTKGMRVSFPTRKMCRMVGEAASQNIERLSYASRLQARRLIVNSMPNDKNPSGFIVASSEDLLKLLDADFGMLSIGDETETLGRVAQSQEALAMLEYLRLRNFTSVLTTQDISQDFPDLRYTPGFLFIAGLLYVPLSVSGHDFIVFFRKSQVREVRWAGNPYEKITKSGTTGCLEPRSSFKAWHETVVGQCREWTEEQVETATVLCLVYGKFINVWRQKEAGLQNTRLTRLLLANSAHEVRTPLNAIINYLEIALDESIDRETRENLAKTHSASKSLIYVINDLLDLTKAEEGKELVKDEVINFSACISEATEPFSVIAQRKGIVYEVIEHEGVPKYVRGDYRRVRQAVSNVTANAMKNTTAGFVKVELFVTEALEDRARVEIIVHDTGCGMSNEQLDHLFQDLEQVSSSSSAGYRDSEAFDDSLDQPGESRTLGLGLAVVARLVRNMDGQLRVRSEEGEGSKFVIQLPFELANSDTGEKRNARDATVHSAPNMRRTLATVTKTPPPTAANDFLLVDRGGGNVRNFPQVPLSKCRSSDDIRNTSRPKFNRSSNVRSTKGVTNRFANANQAPPTLGEGNRDINQFQLEIPERGRGHRNMDTSSLPDTDAPRRLAAQTGLLGQSQPPSPSAVDIFKVPGAWSGVLPIRERQTVKISTREPGKPNQYNAVAEMSSQPGANVEELRILVAEDDPINMKILTKRLEKSGHDVYPAVNGKDCASLYKENPRDFDVILMDMQMPIVDGLASTKLIRAFEKSDEYLRILASDRNSRDHIPIFAVSASLVERDKAIYTEAGFDGWILKPINFERLNILLKGITSDNVREQCLYQPGEWEHGGWFARRTARPLPS
ncbi:hsp90-like protein [Xylaria nigripes]|nr:hsp90-like protein [Xylaria nigripes]